MDNKELREFLAKQERRVEENHLKFMERHNEIMNLIERSRNDIRNAPISTANTDRSE